MYLITEYKVGSVFVPNKVKKKKKGYDRFPTFLLDIFHNYMVNDISEEFFFQTFSL